MECARGTKRQSAPDDSAAEIQTRAIVEEIRSPRGRKERRAIASEEYDSVVVRVVDRRAPDARLGSRTGGCWRVPGSATEWQRRQVARVVGGVAAEGDHLI